MSSVLWFSITSLGAPVSGAPSNVVTVVVGMLTVTRALVAPTFVVTGSRVSGAPEHARSVATSSAKASGIGRLRAVSVIVVSMVAAPAGAVDSVVELPEGPCVVVGDRFADLRVRVHDEGAVLDDGLAKGLAVQ